MSVISVGDILCDSDLLTARFSCNLELCHGACCVEGELGAPVLPHEAKGIEDAAARLSRELPDRGRQVISRYGALEIYRGDVYTRTVDGGECVFAFQENGITLCAIERAREEGRMGIAKPISCRLFPIRVRKKFGLDYLVYEQHAMCRTAREEGTRAGVLLVDFLERVLEERYGESTVASLKALVT